MYVVVGATEGIGKSLSLTLAKRGLKVVALSCRPQELSRLRSKAPSKITVAPIDFSQPSSISPSCLSVLPTKISGAVQCVGSHIAPNVFRRIDPEHLIYHFNNFLASMKALLQEIGTRMSASDRMVVLDSRSAKAPKIGWGALSALKTPAQMSANVALDELQRRSVTRVFLGASGSKTPDYKNDVEAEKAYRSMVSEGGQFPINNGMTAFVSSLLLDVPLDTLRSKSTWDNTDPEQCALVTSFRKLRRENSIM